MGERRVVLDLVSLLERALEACREQVLSDFDGVQSGEVVLHVNRSTDQITVQTKVTKTYRPSANATSAPT